MFTGIVTDIGEVLAVTPRAEGLRRLRIGCRYPRISIAEGASIACSGICLTVVGTGEGGGQTWFEVDAAAETMRVTTAGRWRAGTKVNLERPLKVGDELGGHVVAGHVDGVAVLTNRENLPDMARLELRAPAGLARFIAAKGSVTLDGVSLTVNDIAGDLFSVLVIPHTLKVTTFGGLASGNELNLEVDLMARYAARLMEARPASADAPPR
jgi:riboflavin synthase